jgi:heavy metal sensor kinase
LTLTNRLSASFLGALALILVGFSTALYVLASMTLNRSVDDRLDAALATLGALAEDEPGGLDWEPDERQFSIGLETGHDQVRWRVLDDRGLEVDRSKNLGDPAVLGEPGSRRDDPKGRPWRVAHRRLVSSHPAPWASTRSNALLIAAGLPLEPVDRPLKALAVTLPLLSTGLWGLTALVGRRLCRTALAPLTRMAADARSLGAHEPARRLPAVETGDELQDLALAFNGLLDRWQEALERQASFAGDASHQLRTPLTALIGQVDVALRRERPPEEYRRTLARVRDQSDRLRTIIEALLYLARADAEAGLPALEVLELSGWAADQIRRRSEESGGDPDGLRIHPAGSCPVRAHPALLAEVLDNLLDNARDHGRGAGPVEVRIFEEAGWARLAVEDHGQGIAPVDLARIFEPFYRSSDARRAAPGGVGLGLAVARRIAVSLGGRLEAESRPGLGSRFVLSLPMVERPPESEPDDSTRPAGIVPHNCPIAP